MAATLTFEIGRRPGIRHRQKACRHTLGMTSAQRVALAELVRGPGGGSLSNAKRKGSRLDLVWPLVLALAFVLGGRALFEGVRFVQSADASRTIRVAQPQVDVTITRLPTTMESVHAAAPSHSSTAVSRTM